jgi:hypothetical protein
VSNKMVPIFPYYKQCPGQGVTGVIDLRGPGPQRAHRGPGKTKSCASKGGPGRPNHALPKGPGRQKLRATEGLWKVVYGCDPAVSHSHPGKCNKAHIAIK